MFVSVFSLLRIRGFLGSVVYLVYPTGRVRVSVCRRYWIWNPGLLYLSGWNRVYHLRVFSFNQSIILYICDMLRTAIIYSLVDYCLSVVESGILAAFDCETLVEVRTMKPGHSYRIQFSSRHVRTAKVMESVLNLSCVIDSGVVYRFDVKMVGSNGTFMFGSLHLGGECLDAFYVLNDESLIYCAAI